MRIRNVEVAVGQDDLFSLPNNLRRTNVRKEQPWFSRLGPKQQIVPEKPDACPTGPSPHEQALSATHLTFLHPQPPQFILCCPGPRAPNRFLPGDTEGDGGLQKSSNSELRSQTLPSQLPGDTEDLSGASVSCDSGDRRPRGSVFAPPALEVLPAEKREDRSSGWA